MCQIKYIVLVISLKNSNYVLQEIIMKGIVQLHFVFDTLIME